jgi:hypothetical protein
MAGRDGLVPAPTVDKNGRQTTVYKRTAPPTQRRKVPAPASPSVNSLDEDIALVMKMLGMKGNDARRQVLSVLWQFPSSFRLTLQGMLRQSDRELATHIAGMIRSNEGQTTIRECNSLLRAIDVPDLELGTALVKSLRHCNQLQWAGDYSVIDDKLRAQCIALMNTTAAVAEVSPDTWPALILVPNATGTQASPIIADEFLVQAVLEHPDEAPAIIRVIREHRLSSYRPIRAILDGITIPLVDGVL